MNVQKNIDKILLALKMNGHEYFINTQQFKSVETDRIITKYIIYDDNPKDGIECYSKVKVLENLVFYTKIYCTSVVIHRDRERKTLRD